VITPALSQLAERCYQGLRRSSVSALRPRWSSAYEFGVKRYGEGHRELARGLERLSVRGRLAELSEGGSAADPYGLPTGARANRLLFATRLAICAHAALALEARPPSKARQPVSWHFQMGRQAEDHWLSSAHIRSDSVNARD